MSSTKANVGVVVRARTFGIGEWFVCGALALSACGDEEARDPGPAADGATSSDATVAAPLDAATRPLDSSLSLDATFDATRRDAAWDPDAAPRLSEIVETYFANSCVFGRCHTTLSPQGGLALTGRRISVHDVLVNGPSIAAPGRTLVVPYRPDASYLMEKLESETPAVGTRMPPGAVPELEEITRVRAWILAGAPND